MAVGARGLGYEPSSGYSSGGKLMFDYRGTQWSFSEMVVAPDGADYDFSGTTAAINEDLLVSGA